MVSTRKLEDMRLLVAIKAAHQRAHGTYVPKKSSQTHSTLEIRIPFRLNFILANAPFASVAQGRGILVVVSSDGMVKQRIFPQARNICEPKWAVISRANLFR